MRAEDDLEVMNGIGHAAFEVHGLAAGTRDLG